MKQVLAYPLALLIAAPGSAQALGLGNIERKSALNQPFNATIELVGPQAEDLDSLSVRLADLERFQNAGIERAAILSQLRFEVVQTEHGADFIRITSSEPIKEPFLDFLVEVRWASGKIFREYTVLLDPPNYGPSLDTAARRPAGRAVASTRALRIDAPAHFDQSPGSQTQPSNSANGSYGPIRANETLWPIADRVRPDSKISVHQMMLALLRANPDAFVTQNVNDLKKGAVLRVPQVSELSATSQSDALAEIRRQFADWRAQRNKPTPATRTRGQQSVVAPQTTAKLRPESDAQLKLLIPSAAGLSGTASDSAQQNSASAKSAAGTQDLAVVREALDTQKQENADLKAKLSDTDETLKLMQRQMELKNQELAELQAQLTASKPSAAADENGTSSQRTQADAASANSNNSVATPAPTDAAQSQPPVAPTRAVVAKPVTDRKLVEPPASEASGGWSAMFDMVPGGIYTAIGAAVVTLGAAIFGLLRLRRRDKSENETGFVDDEAPVFMPRGELTPVVSAASGDAALERTHPGADETDSEQDASDDQQDTSRVQSSVARVRFENDSTLGLTGEIVADPLAEVNVYLAYEQFDQAEALVQEAIRTHPGVPDYKLRLLEVYYSAGNHRAYENYARLFRDVVNGAGPMWESALAMWQAMSPGRALFDTSGNAPVQPHARSGGQFVDLTKDAGGATDLASDLQDGGLDFDLNSGSEATDLELEEAPDLLDLTRAAGDRSAINDMVDLTALETAAQNDDESGVIDLTAEVEHEATLGSMFDVGGVTETMSQTVDHAPAFVPGGRNTLDLSFDLSPTTAPSESSLLDVTADIGVPSDAQGDILDLTSSGLDTTPRTTDLGTDVPPTTEVDFDILDLTQSGNDSINDSTHAGGGTFDLEPPQPKFQLETSAFVPAGLDLEQDMSPGESTLTNVHDVPDIDFSLSTGALVQSSTLPAANNELASIEDDAKLFEEFGLGLEDSADEEARLHLNVSESDSEMRLELEQNPTEASTSGEFMDIFSEAPNVPIEALTSTPLDRDLAESPLDLDDQRMADDLDSKLNLAKAFLEVGDSDGAESLLGEIDDKGSSAQKEEAAKIRAQMRG